MTYLVRSNCVFKISTLANRYSFTLSPSFLYSWMSASSSSISCFISCTSILVPPKMFCMLCVVLNYLGDNINCMFNQSHKLSLFLWYCNVNLSTSPTSTGLCCLTYCSSSVPYVDWNNLKNQSTIYNFAAFCTAFVASSVTNEEMSVKDLTICFVNAVCASTNALSGLRIFSSVTNVDTKYFLEPCTVSMNVSVANMFFS